MFAGLLALLAEEFKVRERGTAFGAFGAISGASVAMGPLIGGALPSGISWRSGIFVNVPIGALALRSGSAWRLKPRGCGRRSP